MKTFYWFNILGGFDTAFCILASILAASLFVIFIIYYMDNIDKGNDDKSTLTTKKIAWKLFIPLCITTMAAIFTPSKEDMYIIYGVGGTLDYLKENPEASKLPDKTVELLNVAMDEYIKDHKDKKTEE